MDTKSVIKKEEKRTRKKEKSLSPGYIGKVYPMAYDLCILGSSCEDVSPGSGLILVCCRATHSLGQEIMRDKIKEIEREIKRLKKLPDYEYVIMDLEQEKKELKKSQQQASNKLDSSSQRW